MTANYREWRHVFRMRASKPAHPQMKEVMIPLLKTLQNEIPVVFDDLTFDTDQKLLDYLTLTDSWGEIGDMGFAEK
jgi:thymidylate synthase (FAD)